MRSPWNVHRDELAAALARAAPAAHDVFTLTCDELFGRRLRTPNVTGMPPFAAALSSAMITATSLSDVLLDPDRVPDEGGRVAAESWGQSHADVARRMRADGASRTMFERVAHARLLVDLANEVPEISGPDPSEISAHMARFLDWMDRSAADVTRMPCLGRLRALLFTRMRNGADWVANDFTDMHYLSCAAGYADVVVGERRTIGDLRTARGLEPRARLVSTLHHAVLALTDLGVTSDA